MTTPRLSHLRKHAKSYSSAPAKQERSDTVRADVLVDLLLVSIAFCAMPLVSYATIDLGDQELVLRPSLPPGEFISARGGRDGGFGGFRANFGRGSRSLRGSARNANRNGSFGPTSAGDHVQNPIEGWKRVDHPPAAGAEMGAAAAVNAASIGGVRSYLPANCGAMYVSDVSYYQCGSKWYRPRYAGTAVQYIVVSDPRSRD